VECSAVGRGEIGSAVEGQGDADEATGGVTGGGDGGAGTEARCLLGDPPMRHDAKRATGNTQRPRLEVVLALHGEVLRRDRETRSYAPIRSGAGAARGEP